MARIVMKAIDFNSWMSTIKFIQDGIKKYAAPYRLSGSVDILPSYPRDLSHYKKPSIIIQRVDANNKSVGFGGFIGQYYDEQDNAMADAFGTEVVSTYQLDVDADNNSSCALFTSMIAEDIIMSTKYMNHGEFILYDFTGDVNNPVEIGKCKITDTPDEVALASNLNNDYVSFIRFDITVIQVIVPVQDYVDLSKGIKYNQTIEL